MLPPILPEDVEVPTGDVVYADVRWYLDGRSGRDAYERGHLPGAVFVDLDTVLAAHGEPAIAGRHPFPSPEDLAAALGSLGIGDDTTVLAYDDSGGGTAGRLVWMLRITGRSAALLDGGIRWRNLPLETGPSPQRTPRLLSAVAWPEERFVTADEIAAAAAAGGPVLDARSPERFEGRNETIDRLAGHIPGARNAPWAGALDPTGRFLTVSDQRRRLEQAIDGDPSGTICYCGSGVSACANLLALEQIGVDDARLYVASWSGWSSDSDRRVAVGPAAPDR